MFVATSLLCLLGNDSLAADYSQETSSASITRSAFAPVPLKTQGRAELAATSDSPTPIASKAPLVTVGSSLAIVLGLFAALVWVSRKASKNSVGNREIPDDAMRILGKKSLGTSGSIALVRCGHSLLIVGVHTSGMQRLGEISDIDEVRHIEALCRGESKASFDATLAEMQREPIKRGFTGDEIHVAPRSRHKLFG
jgi:flagellar biogenesis protein FliO